VRAKSLRSREIRGRFTVPPGWRGKVADENELKGKVTSLVRQLTPAWRKLVRTKIQANSERIARYVRMKSVPDGETLGKAKTSVQEGE